MIVPATKMDVKIDNEALMRNICPLSAIRGFAATGEFHLTSGQKHLKYRQGYHPREELQEEKRKFTSRLLVGVTEFKVRGLERQLQRHAIESEEA
jgi:hypothetical protein